MKKSGFSDGCVIFFFFSPGNPSLKLREFLENRNLEGHNVRPRHHHVTRGECS